MKAIVVQTQAETAVMAAHSCQIGRSERAGNETITATAKRRPFCASARSAWPSPQKRRRRDTRFSSILSRASHSDCRAIPGFQEQTVQARQYDNARQRDQKVK